MHRSLRLSFDHKILIGLASGALLLAVVLLLAYRSVQQVRVTSAEAHRTQEVRLKLGAIAETVLNMETGQRGFMLTAREAYIQPYEAGRKRLADELAALQVLLTGHGLQQENLRALQRLLDTRQKQMEHALMLRRTESFEAALAFMITDQGHVTMEVIRDLLGRMSQEEVRVTEIHRAGERDSLRRNFFFSTALSIIAVGLLLVIYLLIRREIAMRAGVARQLDAVNASLEARVREGTRELSASNSALREEIEQRRSAEAQLQQERELLEARVNERTAELVAASESKSRFLSAASHDLRQPLHSLMLLNATLRGQPLAGPAREIVEAQKHSLESMSSLVHALLNISMLESGVVQPQVRAFSLEEILTPLRAEFQPLAAAKGLRLQIDAAGQTVRSDPTLLKEVVQNLLGNAIRYTDCGEARVCIRREADAVRIEISDTGPGIPADRVERIFEEFQQLRLGGRTREGFGLGLSIVRHLVKLLGIELDVKSTLGAGTSFTLEVPVGEAPQRVERPAATPAAEPRTGARILLIDDEAPVRNATALFLSVEGHHVVCAASAEEALAKLQQMQPMPDLIVSDYQLGTPTTGAELIEQLRMRARRTIPAVVLSGDTLRVTRRCAGIEDCRIFHKPVDADELAQHVRAAIEPRREMHEAEVAGS